MNRITRLAIVVITVVPLALKSCDDQPHTQQPVREGGNDYGVFMNECLAGSTEDAVVRDCNAKWDQIMQVRVVTVTPVPSAQ